MDEDNLIQANSEPAATDGDQNLQTDNSVNGEQAAQEPNLPRWSEVAIPDNEKAKEPQKEVSQGMSGTTMAILGAAVGQIFASQPAKEEPKKPIENKSQKVPIKIVRKTGEKKRPAKRRRTEASTGKK